MPKHLLVVDDEPEIRKMISFAFEAAGYRVTATDNGLATLSQLLSDDHPHAVIIGDLAPRPETSLTLVNDVRVAFSGPNLPVVMLSTQAGKVNRTMGLAAGADLYLTKPFSLSTLVGTIDDLINRAA